MYDGRAVCFENRRLLVEVITLTLCAISRVMMWNRTVLFLEHLSLELSLSDWHCDKMTLSRPPSAQDPSLWPEAEVSVLQEDFCGPFE